MEQINGHKIEYVEMPMCEHCGDGHSYFGVQINDDGIYRCLYCYQCDNPVSKEDEQKIIAVENIKRTEWLLNELENLK